MKEKWIKSAPAILRLSVSFIFLWFGVNQLANPQWFIGYLPLWSLKIVSASTLLVINGLVEIVLGLLLLLGIAVRLSALLLSLHLLSITLSLGYNDVAVRDLGLTLATFSVFLAGDDRWCLGKRIFHKKNLVK